MIIKRTISDDEALVEIDVDGVAVVWRPIEKSFYPNLTVRKHLFAKSNTWTATAVSWKLGCCRPRDVSQFIAALSEAYVYAQLFESLAEAGVLTQEQGVFWEYRCGEDIPDRLRK